MKTKSGLNRAKILNEKSKSSINFFTENINYTLKHKKRLKAWLTKALNEEKKNKFQINYILTDDSNLLDLNLKFLKHNFYTDILTFEYSEGKNVIGDIYISLERIKENSKIYKVNFSHELDRVMIHGILHLCGHKDKSKAEKNQMTEKENYYLSLY